MAENGYVSYLLRLWRSEVAGRPEWRATLECTRTGERLTFSLEGLLAYLQAHFGTPKTASVEVMGTDQDSGSGSPATWGMGEHEGER